jgi:hypothetical protein
MLKFDPTVMRTYSSFEEADKGDRESWWARSPVERLIALEHIRQLNWRYDADHPPDFSELLKCFNSARVQYLVVAGYGVSFHGYHRFTQDRGVWIAVDPNNATRVSKALQQFGFEPEAVPPTLFVQKGRIFAFGREPFRVDILTAPFGVNFMDCYAKRVGFRIGDVTVPFIALDDLKVNTRASGRAREMADLENLPLKSLVPTKPTKRTKPEKGKKSKTL